MGFLFLIPIILPIVTGIYMLKRNFTERRARERCVASVVIVNAVIAIFLSWFMQGQELKLFPLVAGEALHFRIDSMSSIFATLVSVLWILCIFYAFEYMTHEGGENRFFAFYTMAFGVMIGFSFAANLITLYLFYEMLTLITLPLVIHSENKQSKTAARIYLCYSLTGAAIALAAIMIIVGQAGTSEFVAGGVLTGVASGLGIIQLAYVLAFFGFGVKSAVLPFHAWLPCASVAPTPVSALLHAVAVVKAGVFAVARVTYFSVGTEHLWGTLAQNIALAASLLTILYGSYMALRMQHLKRRLAYSTVSQLSYILLGISLMSPEGYTGAMIYLVGHAIVKITLFLCAGAIIYKTHREYTWELKGLGRTIPVTMIVFTIASFALVGIPPFPGFFGKWYLITAAVGSVDNPLVIAAPVVLGISSLLTAIYLFSICAYAFIPGKGFDDQQLNKGITDPNKYMTIPLIILAVTIVCFGIFIDPIVRLTTLEVGM